MTTARTATVVGVAGVVLGAAGTFGLIVLKTGWDPLAPSQPPIKVRGGAMTLRYAAASNGTTQWFPYQSNGVNGFCTPLDTSSGKAKLKIVQHPDPDDPAPVVPPSTLSGNWVVDLSARKDDFTEDPQEGLELQPVSNCNGNAAGVSALPVPGSMSSGFYSVDLPSSDGKTFGKRYKKTSCNDEDICEHMGAVYLNRTRLAECENGECLVKIVVP